MTELSYFIWSIPYNSTSGGAVALHRLAHEMTLLGLNVTLVADTKNPDWNYKHITHEEYYLNIVTYNQNAVAIYPEIVNGNPFKCCIVVHWLLNTPGVLGGNGIYEENDLIYKFMETFKAPDESKVKGILSIWTLDETLSFIDKGEHIPGTTCYLVRKGHSKPLNKHPSDALCIDDYGFNGGHEYLREVFDKYETFICYDHHCHITNFSALAGCKTIIIPDGNESVQEYIDGDGFAGLGKAYGFADIQRAQSTLHLLRGKIVECGANSHNQIRKLVQDCQNICNGDT